MRTPFNQIPSNIPQLSTANIFLALLSPHFPKINDISQEEIPSVPLFPSTAGLTIYQWASSDSYYMTRRPTLMLNAAYAANICEALRFRSSVSSVSFPSFRFKVMEEGLILESNKY